ncbi:uncharacterized protein LOC110441961 [Mizuhopecten yessoensis]|uniref:uncharacterized protein LOC110441961 n=1 Tax=Mizuhopecten yessoensis TaxID=6573 RepID=UPI000B45B6C2|nr:uncharacterized protein LOC110441961 [Mizuhopecten yessoensis]XP_021340961.1 uncharacterized protein LOC110441961 [Mizuhopecten yessoensis]
MSSASASSVIHVKKITDCCKDWQCNKTLVQCLDHLFTHSLDTDVTFLLGRNGENVKAHSFILKARSPVLCKLLSAVQSQQWKITLFRYSKQTVTMFLRYIYTDMVTLTIPDAVTLLGVARQFKVNNLVNLCEAYLRINTPKSIEDVTAVISEDEKLSKLVQNTRVNTCDTEDRIRSVAPELHSSVDDVSSALPASKFLLDDQPKSGVNITSVSQALQNLLKRRQTVDSTSKPAKASVLMTLEGSVMTKRRCVTDDAPTSVEVSSVVPVRQPGSKQQHMDSVSKPSDDIGPALPVNYPPSQYAKNKMVAITNLENGFVDEILGKTSETQPLDGKVSSTTHLGDKGVEVKYQRQTLRYNFVGKTLNGPHIEETISGTTSQEQHLKDEVSRKTSQEQYLGNKISRKKSRCKTLAPKTSEKTFLGKHLSDEILGKTSQRELLVNDVQGKVSQGQNLGGTSSKVITQKKRRRGKNLDTASCGQPDSAKITVGMATAVCNGSVTDLTKRDSSVDARNNSSDSCNGHITKNDTIVDRQDVTSTKPVSDSQNYNRSGVSTKPASDNQNYNRSGVSTKPASDNQNYNRSGVSAEHPTKPITDKENNIACTIPVVSGQEKSSVKEQINNLKCQIEYLKADIINNHGYLVADDNNSSPICQDECTIVAMESGTRWRGASDTDDAYEGDVQPTDQVVIDEENEATPLDLTTAPGISGTKKVTTSIQHRNMPSLHSLGVCSVGETYRPQSETVQESHANKSEKVVKKKNKKKKKKKKGKKILNEATVIKTASVVEETANKKRYVEKNVKHRQQILKEESKKPRESVKNKKTSKTPTMTLDKCEVCGECFTSAISLLIHMREHAGEQIHQCALCGKGFTLLGALQHHMQKHKEKELMRCKICGKWYASKTAFKRHCNAHNDAILKCKDCGLICETKLLYNRHMKKGKHKMDSLQYKCRNCCEAFMFKRELTKHNKIHIKGFKCEVCNKSFSSKWGRERHLKLHKAGKIEKKTYKCDSCTCVLDSPESLSEHSKVHKNSIELDSPEAQLELSKVHKEGQASDDSESQLGRTGNQESQLDQTDSQASQFEHTYCPDSQFKQTDCPESQSGHTDHPESKLEHTNSPESPLEHIDSLKSQSGHIDSSESQSGHIDSPETQAEHIDSPETQAEHIGSLETQTEHIGSQETQADHIGSQETQAEHIDSPETQAERIDSPETQAELIDSPETQADHIDSPETQAEHMGSQETQAEHIGSQETQTEHIGSQETQADHIGSQETQTEHTDNLESHLAHIEKQKEEFLTCDLCSKSFDHIENLEAHQKTHQAKDVYECILCKKMFLKKCFLDRHYKYHSGDQYFSCDLCDEGFDKKKELLQHQFTAHDKKMAYSYSCSTCYLVFKSHKSFRKHMLCHSNTLKNTSQNKLEKPQQQT